MLFPRDIRPVLVGGVLAGEQRKVAMEATVPDRRIKIAPTTSTGQERGAHNAVGRNVSTCTCGGLEAARFQPSKDRNAAWTFNSAGR
jgi:hypothetical protein